MAQEVLVVNLGDVLFEQRPHGEDRPIHPETLAALQRFRGHGNELIGLSGRSDVYFTGDHAALPDNQARPLFEGGNPFSAIAISNGSSILWPADSRGLLADPSLGGNAIERVSGPGGAQYVREDLVPLLDERVPELFKGDYGFGKDRTMAAVQVDPDLANAAGWAAVLAAEVDARLLKRYHLPYETAIAEHNVMIVRNGVSKANALQHVARVLGLSLEKNAVAIGSRRSDVDWTGSCAQVGAPAGSPLDLRLSEERIDHIAIAAQPDVGIPRLVHALAMNHLDRFTKTYGGPGMRL